MNKTKQMKWRLFMMPMGFLFALVFMLGSCEDKDNKAVPQPPKSGVPIKATSFYPDSGKIAEKVIILGENFGTDPSLLKVYFNKKRGKVVGCDGTSMYVVCPRMPGDGRTGPRGDTCNIAVVYGKDSIILPKIFRYKQSVSVSTIVGNGKYEFSEGTLSTATIRARYLAVDEDDNIFAIQRSDGTDGLVRINEEENSVTIMTKGLDAPNALCIFKSGVIYFPADYEVPLFYTANPMEGWAVRAKRMITPFTNAMLGDGQYKHAMAACEWDNKVYTRHRSGDIVRFDQETLQAEPVYKTPWGDCYGIAFHPHQPTMLYMAMLGEVRDGCAHSICCIDVSNPESSFKKLTGPITSGSFRNGPVEQAQ